MYVPEPPRSALDSLTHGRGRTYSPVTTLAQAYQKDPKVFSRVARVVSMGGAIDVPGNTSATAEFNVFADP